MRSDKKSRKRRNKIGTREKAKRGEGRYINKKKMNHENIFYAHTSFLNSHEKTVI